MNDHPGTVRHVPIRIDLIQVLKISGRPRHKSWSGLHFPIDFYYTDLVARYVKRIHFATLISGLSTSIIVSFPYRRFIYRRRVV